MSAPAGRPGTLATYSHQLHANLVYLHRSGPMPDDDNNRSRSYAEYHASENVTKAFLRSWEFRSAQVMCLGAASAAGVAIVFALTGSFAIDNKKADIRDQLERRATEAR